MTCRPYSVATQTWQKIPFFTKVSANRRPSVVPEKINISAIFSPFPGLLSALICTRLSACPDLITAFYYIVPHLKYGQWATLVTTSTNAYGTTGKSGGSSTSTSSNGYTSSYYDYLNYLNYSQMYYGNNGYYGGYYNDYYGYGGLGNYGYYGGYYGGYGGNYDSGETTTTTKVYTDIPSFSPLIFQIYIEPDGK